jgi:nucleotide-binding universal stress UspA family protein
MAYREILVVVENAVTAAQRVAPAAALAAGFGARLTGFFATGYPISTAYGDLSGWAELVDAYMQAQRAEASAAEAAFRQELAARKLTGEWLYREAEATASVIAEAALFDLVVLGQPNPDSAPGGSFGVRPEEIVLGGGRPVLLVPYAGSFAEFGKRVLVAWNRRREAVRALHDALPILERAEAVTVIEVDPSETILNEPVVSAQTLVAELSRRGVAASAESETSGDLSVDNVLLSRAADLGADLLVMGAYGHSRLREYVLGGVSRGIFRQMTIPVLMAH